MARCILFLEMNIKLINIIEDTQTADYFYHLLAALQKSMDRSQSFKICNAIFEIPGISKNFGLKCLIN